MAAAQSPKPKAQSFLEELVATVALDGIEVALALHQQSEVAAHDVAVDM